MNHEFFMKLAIDMAEKTRGQTSPNPQVGAVLVNNGEIVGLGTHLRPGEPHAEIHALNMAGEKAKGGTLYVTLEPCSHYGRTPPCAEAIIQAGVKKVILGDSYDPNPSVSGRGIAMLRRAGIEVMTGVMEKEATLLNEFFHYFTRNRVPFVTLKTACSLDGKIASRTGHSQWITGEEARRDGHVLRHQHDAILVGIGTVLADNPRLTTRLESGGKNPVRIVLDSRLRIPLTSNLVTDSSAPTWIFTLEGQLDSSKMKELTASGITVIPLKGNRIHPQEVLSCLGEKNITSLLIEGGRFVNQTFIESKSVNRIVLYVAPKMIGGDTAPSFLGGLGVTDVNKAWKLEQVQVDSIGNDLRITGNMPRDQE